MSQLALASTVGSTARHLSFLETGRSRPSAQMVLRLGEALDVPLRERNELLHAAGLAAAFPQVGLGSANLAPFRAARAPFDDTLTELLQQAQAALGDLPEPRQPVPDFVLCPWYRVGDRVIKTIGVAAQFDATTEVTLNELRIELSYPLDQTSDEFFRGM